LYLCTALAEDIESIFVEVRRKLIWMISFGALAVAFEISAWIIVMLPFGPLPALVLSSSLIVQSPATLLPAVTTITLLLSLQSLHCLEFALAKYVSMIDSSQEIINRRSDSERMMSIGFDLITLSEQADSCFGGILFFEYCLHLSNITCCTFFATGISAAFTATDGPKPAHTLNAIHYLMLAVYGFRRIWSFQNVGQMLCNRYQEIRRHLQHMRVDFAEDDLSRKNSCQLNTLIELFSNPSPIRPLDVFNMNYANGASVAGLILTYWIILIQLKLSDSS
jgi:hypothetical protein